jgi:hypothetical protein
MNEAHQHCGSDEWREMIDSLASDELAVHHEGDTYNPVDPDSLPDRLAAAGFERIDVRTNPYGWAVVAHRG